MRNCFLIFQCYSLTTPNTLTPSIVQSVHIIFVLNLFLQIHALILLASESKPALIFGNAAKETLAARNKENAPGISSTAPAKPFDFSSKTSLFAPPSASSNPLFGFSTTVSAAPQPSKVQDPQPTQVTSLFTTLRQPAVQSQPGVSVSLQSQQTALPKSSSLLAGSSTVSVSSTFVTSGNKNALLNREAGEKKEVEGKLFRTVLLSGA